VFDVTLGTLSSDDLTSLEEWGLVGEDVGILKAGEQAMGDVEVEEGKAHNGHSGLTWFNDLVDGSRLGKTKRMGENREGPGWRIEWEIMEWIEGDDESAADTPLTGNGGMGAKRKIGDVESEDVSMQG